MKKNFTSLSKNWLRCGLIAALTFTSLGLQAQVAPAIEWDRTIGGDSSDFLYTFQQLPDKSYILGGSTRTNINGDKTQASKGISDFWVVKLDSSRNVLWDKSLGGSGSESLRALVQTPDGGFIAGGVSTSNISGDKSQNSQGPEDYWIIKLDANGNKLWDKTFGGNSADNLYSISLTNDGGFILGGDSQSGQGGDKTQISRGHKDYWIIKIDSSGNKLWDKSFGGNDVDWFNSIQQTNDGGFILGGSSNSLIGSDKSERPRGTRLKSDFWIIKLDSNGNKLWDKTLGGNDADNLLTLQQTNDGGYILGGWSNSGISGEKSQPHKGGLWDYWIVKVDSIGNKVWDKTFGGTENDLLYSIKQTSDNGYILGGDSFSDNNGDKTEVNRGGNDYWIIKTDSIGNKMWDKTIGGNNYEYLYSLQVVSNNEYIIGGSSNSGMNGEKSHPSKGYHDYWLVKLSNNVTGLKEPKSSFDVTVYPNPSKGKFNLRLTNLNTPFIEVSVTDLLGKTILEKSIPVINSTLPEEINLPQVKGLYLLQLKTGNEIVTRKIVVE